MKMWELFIIHNPIPKVKQCIICDNILMHDNQLYLTNHYLCSKECANTYIHYSRWSNTQQRFVITPHDLNYHRELIKGIEKLSFEELDMRRDVKND